MLSRPILSLKPKPPKTAQNGAVVASKVEGLPNHYPAPKIAPRPLQVALKAITEAESLPPPPKAPYAPAKTKAERDAMAEETLAILRREFPVLFPMTEADLLPLALGSRQQLREALQARGIEPASACTGARISAAIAFFRRLHPRYDALLLIPGTPRRGLDGQPAGQVTEQEAESFKKHTQNVKKRSL